MRSPVAYDKALARKRQPVAYDTVLARKRRPVAYDKALARKRRPVAYQRRLSGISPDGLFLREGDERKPFDVSSACFSAFLEAMSFILASRRPRLGFPMQLRRRSLRPMVPSGFFRQDNRVLSLSVEARHPLD
jgi:hypothetical protein